MHRTKLTVAVVIIGVVALSLSSGAMAAKKKVSGQDLYKEFCKPCHQADSEHGEYTPMTLIQDQWTRFFEDDFVDTHKDVMDPDHGNVPVTKTLSEDELKVLIDWTVDHAADSEHPMTCG